MNSLDIVNITPDYPPETITNISTTEKNIIHILTRHMNNITMGITSTGSKTNDPRSNISSTMEPHLQGFQL